MSMTAFEIFGVLKLDKKDYEKGLKSAKSTAKNVLSGVGSAVGGMAKAGAMAVTAATGAVTAFAGSAVQAGSAFDQAMGGVAATLGESVDELNSETGSIDTSFGHFEGTLRDFAKFMGTNTTFSATQAAEALNYMALAGYKTQESMEMLPAVLDMAAAGAMDLARASDMITDTQSALGLSFERTDQMVNEFAKAASSGNTSVEQLGEAFLRVGGLAKELNGGMITLADGTEVEIDGVQQLEVAFTAMANAGIKGAEAGTHMRNMLLKLSSPTDKGAKALEEMGVSVFNAEGKMRSLGDIFGDLNTAMSTMSQENRVKTISKLFNTRDLASAEALLAAVEGDFDSLGESIMNAGTAANEMAETKLDNLLGDVTLFKSALESAQIEVNDKLSPYMREFVQIGTQGLQDVTKGFTENGLSGAMEALGPTLSKTLNMVMKSLPDLVGAGVGLLSALGQALIDNAPIIRDKLTEMLWMAVADLKKINWRQAAENFIDGLGAAFESMDSMGRAMSAIAELLWDGFMGAMAAVWSKLRQADGSEMGSAIAGFFRNAMSGSGEFLMIGANIIQELARLISEALPELLPVAVEILATLVQNIIDNLDSILDGALYIVQGLADGILAAIPVLVEKLPELLISIVDFLSNPDNLTQVSESGGKIVGALVTGLIKALPQLVWGTLQLVATILQTISNLPQLLLEMGLSGVIGLADGIVEGITGVDGAVSDLIASITDKIQEMVDGALQWGKDLIDNFVKGIGDFAGKVGEGISNVAQDVVDFIGFSEPKKGPLSRFHTFAPDMIDLFTQGIDDNIRKVEDASSDLASAMYPDKLDYTVATVDAKPKSGTDGGNSSVGAKIDKLIAAIEGQKDTVIPIYIGNKMIDELVLDANKRIRLKSGGFANV